MKKLLWISIALALTGCGKQAQAETTVTPTTTEIETTAETTTVAETTNVEEEQNQDMMNVIRQEVIDGDIRGVEIDEEVDMWCDFLSEEQKEQFKSELHLLDSPEPEVIPETTKPQPQETKPVQKPKETQSSNKPAPQPTQATEVYQETATQQTEPVVNEPAPQPAPTQPAVEPGSTVKDANGNEVHRGKLDTNQTLTDEQIDAINNAQWN